MKHYILLDNSASMFVIWSDMLEKLSAYIAKLDSSDTVKLVTFNSSEYKTVRDCSVAGFTEVTANEVSTTGMTPLYDAAGRLFTEALKNDENLTSIIVITDGDENSSKEFSQEAVKKLVDQAEKEKSWEVIYLGAGFDKVYEQVGTYGNVGKTMNMARNAGAMAQTFDLLDARMSAYRSTGIATRAFSAEERATALSEEDTRILNKKENDANKT